MLDMFGACNFSRFRVAQSNTDWTDERVARLRELYAKGSSYQEIADDLGTTRNAVGGKVDRLGLSGQRKDKRRSFSLPRRRKHKGERVIRIRNSQPVTVDLVQYEETPVSNEFMCVPLLELEDDMCKYPRGEGLATVFCGVPVQKGSAYCIGHHSLCYNKIATAASQAKGQQSRDMGSRYRQAMREAPL